jgi:hypothetical protein
VHRNFRGTGVSIAFWQTALAGLDKIMELRQTPRIKVWKSIHENHSPVF